MNHLLSTFSAVTIALSIQCVRGDFAITEFLARNETGLMDQDNEHSDWIEITNVGSEAADLNGWYLSGNEDSLDQWLIPAAVLEPGASRIVFASGKNRGEADGEWHTQFKLSAEGEFLALVKPDGNTIASAFHFPPQFDDISYGVSDNGFVGYLDSTSPGASNGGLSLPGPQLADLSLQGDERPQPGDDLTITVRVDQRANPIRRVSLHSRVMFQAETTVSMVDDGSGADEVSADGIYTGVILGNTLFGPRFRAGEMIRWRVTSEDEGGQTSRLPVHLDTAGNDQSSEYEGTVVADEGTESALPIFHWFTQDETNSNNRIGARAAVFYENRFYDNIYVRQRGQATNGRSQKFDFNSAFPAYINETLSSVRELNLNAEGADPSYLRQPLAFETYKWAGNASCEAFLVVMKLNGAADRTGVLIEQVNEDFLDRFNYDPEGDLYKMVQRENLNPVFADTITGIEKKTGDLTDFSSIEALVAGLNGSEADRRNVLFDQLNLPQVLTYLAVRAVIQDADDIRKNFYIYKDIHGTGEWSIFPWDKDFTFGVQGDGGPNLKHPFFGAETHSKINPIQWNMLFDAVFTDPATKQMYLRRLRTVMDEVLQPEDVPSAEKRLETRLAVIYSAAEAELSGSARSSRAAVDRYFPERRRDLYETFSGTTLVPQAQPTAPEINIEHIEFQPASGNADEEFILLLNPNSYAVDISGWTLSGAVTFTFAPGTVIPAANLFTPDLNKIYVSPDVNGFRARTEGPSGGQAAFVQGSYEGPLSDRGGALLLQDTEGTTIAEAAYEGNPSPLEQSLIVSELMYHPADPNADAEFIELFNLSFTETLDLTGLAFTSGVDFEFPADTTLAPRAYGLLVVNRAAFEAVYGSDLPIVGEFQSGRLSNSGERLRLELLGQGTILDFSYADAAPWPVSADGDGYSLVITEGEAYPDFENPAVWRASSAIGGTPGTGEGGGSGADWEDADGDGLVSIFEEALGLSDTDPSDATHYIAVQVQPGNIVVTTPRNASATEIDLVLETSTDLQSWTADFIFERSELTDEFGEAITQWQLPRDIDSERIRFVRLSARR